MQHQVTYMSDDGKHLVRRDMVAFENDPKRVEVSGCSGCYTFYYLSDFVKHCEETYPATEVTALIISAVEHFAF